MNASKIFAAAIAVALGGCTISSVDPQDPPAMPPLPQTDGAAPVASITFPARDGFSAGSVVRVIGRATDTSTVTEVRVNGIAVTSTDGFQNWSVDVPLVGGDNLLTVSTRDTHGNAAASAAVRHVWQRADLNNAAGGEFNAAGTALYFVDAGARAILAVAIDTGNITRIADLTRFSYGPVPLDLALDLANNRIYLGVRDDESSGDSTIGIWAYDTQAATWAVVSDATRGSGPALQNPTDLVLDTAGNRLLVLDWDAGLFGVNLTTGARTIVSSNTVPSATNALFSEPMDIALDANANRAVVIDRGSDALFAIDLTSGARTLISRVGQQSGLGFSQPLGLALDLPRNRALVWDAVGDQGTIAVDLATGIRTSFADNGDFTFGPDTRDLFQGDTRVLAVFNDGLFSIDTAYDTVQRIDLVSATRTRVSNNGFPANAARLCSSDAEVRAGAITLLSDDGRIVRITADGTRTQLAGEGVPGSAAVPGRTLELDAVANVAYVASYNEIWRVNLANGVVTLLADDTTPANQSALPSIYDIVLDTAAGRLYAVSDTAVISINLADGVRTPLSAANNSLALQWGYQGALDRAGNRLLVSDLTRQHLTAVDLTTGVHSEFSVAGDAGPLLAEPTGVGIDASGNVWAIDDRSALVRIDRVSGARTQVSTLSTPDNLNALGAWRRAIADGGSLYLETMSGGILQVEPTGGTRVGVSSCGLVGAM
jgi:hypothetical protein